MTQTITISGVDCFWLAATYLGDATQFFRILAQNANVLVVDDIVDPVISGPPVTIVIPDVDTSSSGGIPTL